MSQRVLAISLGIELLAHKSNSAFGTSVALATLETWGVRQAAIIMHLRNLALVLWIVAVIRGRRQSSRCRIREFRESIATLAQDALDQLMSRTETSVTPQFFGLIAAKHLCMDWRRMSVVFS